MKSDKDNYACRKKKNQALGLVPSCMMKIRTVESAKKTKKERAEPESNR